MVGRMQRIAMVIHQYWINSLDENVYWTFSKSESRSDFEEDLQKFYNIIYNNILNNINYYYIDIFKLKYNKLKKLYNILSSREKKNIYISNNMVYIPYEGSVLGLSLAVLEYCGIRQRKSLKGLNLTQTTMFLKTITSLYSNSQSVWVIRNTQCRISFLVKKT